MLVHCLRTNDSLYTVSIDLVLNYITHNLVWNMNKDDVHGKAYELKMDQ